MSDVAPRGEIPIEYVVTSHCRFARKGIESSMWYWIAGIVLTLLNAVCVVGNLFMLPGNWLMLGTLCVFLLVTDVTWGPTWLTLVITAALAGVGEAVEAVSGGAGAARRGASRRAIVLSFLFSMVGSIVGTFVVPIPMIGTAAGAVAGAAVGAWLGAWLGEAWIGASPEQRAAVGQAALTGRMIGMATKIGIGMAIFVFQLVSLWL
jgi:hypothetical protein